MSSPIIVRLKKENPRREGTAGWAAWNLLRKGMTVDAYLAAGGRRDHLRWDIDKGNCKLVDAKGKTSIMPEAPKNIFVKGGGGVASVRKIDDSKVKVLRSTRRWKVEREWHHSLVKYKHEGDLKHMWGRECTLMTFISPKGNRYLVAAPHEPADIIVDHSKHGLGITRLRKEKHAPLALRKAIAKKSAIKKEVRATVARKKAKAKKSNHLKTKKRKS